MGAEMLARGARFATRSEPKTEKTKKKKLELVSVGLRK